MNTAGWQSRGRLKNTGDKDGEEEMKTGLAASSLLITALDPPGALLAPRDSKDPTHCNVPPAAPRFLSLFFCEGKKKKERIWNLY